MADPVISSAKNKAFFVTDLSGQNSNPMIPHSFILSHLKGKLQSTKLKLTSDVSNKTWEVKLHGGRFAGGWKDFSLSHGVREDDVLSFRHDGDMVFHVTPLGRSFSLFQILASSSDDEVHDDDVDEHDISEDEDDEDDDNADVGDDDDDDNWISEEELHSKKVSSKKRERTETESSSEELSYLVIHVTPASIRRDTMCLSTKFARSNGLEKRQCDIDLMNEHAKSFTMRLRHNKATGQAFIRGGWKSFCRSNRIKAGSSCRFKLVRNGVKPVLQLCPNTSKIQEGNSSKANKKQNVSDSEGDYEIESEDCLETASMNQNRILTLVLKPYVFRSGQLRLPASFTRENGIMEGGEVTVVNKDGVEWKSHLVNVKGRDQFYIRGCKEFFLASDIKNVGASFTLEIIRGGKSPTLKICSQVKSCDGNKTSEEIPNGGSSTTD